MEQKSNSEPQNVDARRSAVSSTEGLYEDRPCQNTDTEIWRERRGDYYADSIHVTQSGGIGIDCGGHVIVAPVRHWHDAGEMFLCVDPDLPRWKHRLAMWLLGRSSYNHKLDEPCTDK